MPLLRFSTIHDEGAESTRYGLVLLKEALLAKGIFHQ
jgi:hypothetical protein